MGLGAQVAAADGAESRAVRAAEDLVRERERDGVPRPCREVELVLVDVGRCQLVRLPGARRLVLATPHLERDSRVCETAHAGPDEPNRELELEQEPRAQSRQGERRLRLLRDGDIALPAELEWLELDLLDIAELLARLQPDRAEVEGGHT